MWSFNCDDTSFSESFNTNIFRATTAPNLPSLPPPNQRREYYNHNHNHTPNPHISNNTHHHTTEPMNDTLLNNNNNHTSTNTATAAATVNENGTGSTEQGARSSPQNMNNNTPP
jgi:hypothetical protein